LKAKGGVERQLARRLLTGNQEAQIRSLIDEMSIGLGNLDFVGRQELLRLLVEKVVYGQEGIEIVTGIPLGEQLHPLYRRG
jgi:hypothetical protein